MLNFNKSEMQYFQLWLGQTVSSLGSGIASFGLMLWAFQKYNDVSYVGYLFFAQLAPYIYFSIFSGQFIDKFDRKKIIIAADLIQTTILLLLLLTLNFSNQNIPFLLLFCTSLISGLLAGIQSLVFLSSTALFVRKKNLLRFNGFIQFFRFVPRLISPLLALPLL